MWAQLIKMRAKPAKVDALPALFDQLHEAEQPDSGLLRSIAMQEQGDASQVYVLVVFESEEKARAREQDPRRRDALASVQTMMADIFEGPPEFVDLAVMRDVTP